MSIRNKAGYEDKQTRLGSDLEPLTWGETVTSVVITVAIAILTAEFVINLTKIF